jgi:plastocyanin
MRTLSSLSLIALTMGAAAQTTHELTNVEETFVPDLITLQAGDSIHLVLADPHTCTQVDEATWDANGNTSNGGFDYPSGDTTFALNAPGTYYYVCVPHADMGMKGRFVVTASSGIGELHPDAGSRISPNPASKQVHLVGVPSSGHVSVLDANGKVALEAPVPADGMLQVSSLQAGAYTIVVTDEQGKTVSGQRLVIAR